MSHESREILDRLSFFASNLMLEAERSGDADRADLLRDMADDMARAARRLLAGELSPVEAMAAGALRLRVTDSVAAA